MLVEYYRESKKKSVEIDNNKTKAKERKNEFILYTYLEKSPVENKDGEKMIAPSARDFYMTSMESFFKEAKEQGLITSQETINPFNIGNVEFLNDILYNLQKDDKYKVVATNKSRNNRTTSFRHLLDFVENFKVPQIYLFNIKPSDDYWKKYPPEKWQLGINGNKIAYGESANIKKGDIALFKITGDKKAIRHIGRVYDIKKGTVYFEILARLKNDLTLTEMREVTGIENFHQNKLGKISDQQAALQLTIECFKQAEKDGLILNFTNKEQEMPNNIQNKTAKNPPLNQILYGPPGTGKTYNTINKALEILGIETQDESRAELKAKFDKFRQNGRIEFVTFHQSFSYEEFVEGIKPKFINSNEDTETSKMEYEIKGGIFKQICDRAKQYTKEFVDRQKEIVDQQVEKPYVLDKNKTLWRLYTLPGGNIENDFFDECITNNYVKAYYGFGGVELNKAENGDYIVIPSTKYGEMSKTIRAFGILRDNDNKQTKENEIYYKNVEWLWFAKDEIDIIPFNEVNFNRPTFQRVKQGKESIIDYMGILLDKNKESFTTKPYILIIDEINRGNISKILGELITLIEPSKRIGGDEELRVALPYSNESFGVPSNLYIIGTMNTADRSIALLDTALRRRFEFVEMMPQPELLEIIKVENGEIKLQMLLEKMNERIEFLLDREHTIGHSFFINVNSLSELKQVFKNKIIPLLQEYFYDDYAKIDAVLNGNEMIKIPKVEVSSLFSKKDKDLELDDKKIYEITPFENEIWDNPQTYKNIYADKESNSQEINKNEQE